MDWLNDLRADGDRAIRLDSDLAFYASELLRIRPKAGALVPFVFNDAQTELHRRLEEQKAKTGKVRAIVLKARQMGISTYVAARYFRRTLASPGLRTAIIGHERAASRNLFGLVKRFYDHLPEDQKPSLGASNQEELIFSSIDSGYLVSVATLEGSGRSSTAQLLHASEAAFWALFAGTACGAGADHPGYRRDRDHNRDHGKPVRRRVSSTLAPRRGW
jgi:hypothetical protein